MSLPPLTDWVTTCTGLQRAAGVLGAIRKTVTPPLPNAQRLGLFVEPMGLSTGPLPFGGDLLLDFGTLTVHYRQPGEPPATISIAERSQHVLAATVLEMLAQEGHDVSLEAKTVGDDTIELLDADAARAYAAALYVIYTGIARFRARLFGSMTALVMWPHGFDLSFLWFPHGGFDEQQDRHLAFGFSPGSAGLDYAYIYSYGFAEPDPFPLAEVPLPPPARAIAEPFAGVVLPYEALLGREQPAQVLEGMLLEIAQNMEPLL